MDRIDTHAVKLEFADRPYWSITDRAMGAMNAGWACFKGQAKDSTPRGGGAIAVIPVTGVIEQHGSWLLDIFGGTSIDDLTKQFDAAMMDTSVSGIIFDIDSPGGSVYGVQEFADRVQAARGVKPVVAYANSEANSAAYWIGSAAGEFWMTPSGEVGSIGVIAVHADMSKAYEGMGINVSVLTAGKYKGEGNPYQPLTDEGREAIQSRLDDYYHSFTDSVARGRGKKRSEVISEFGEGRSVNAKRAVSSGMVDGVGSFAQVVQRISSKRTSTGKPKSMATRRSQLELLKAGLTTV